MGRFTLCFDCLIEVFGSCKVAILFHLSLKEKSIPPFIYSILYDFVGTYIISKYYRCNGYKAETAFSL